MDEHLRAQPHDVVTLLRAGRLDPERLAMAAYLGDERALASGVEPWVPPAEPPNRLVRAFESLRPAGRLVASADLTRREIVWISALLLDNTLDRFCKERPEPREAVHVARMWCQRRAEDSDVERVNEASVKLSGRLSQETREILDADSTPSSEEALRVAEKYAAHSAHFLCVVATSEQFMRNGAVGIAEVTRHLRDWIQLDEAAEQAWQAKAIADVLLDPDWPPWDE